MANGTEEMIQNIFVIIERMFDCVINPLRFEPIGKSKFWFEISPLDGDTLYFISLEAHPLEDVRKVQWCTIEMQRLPDKYYPNGVALSQDFIS